MRVASFVLSVLVSLVVLFTPGDDVPSVPYVDKAVHIGLFALLAWTGRWAGLGARRLATALLGYAVLSELVQAYGPLERSASPADVAADLVGIGLGLLIPTPAPPGPPAPPTRRAAAPP